jgi:signal transduction histidine kinase
MVFNKFSATVLFLVLLIAATSFVMIWSFEKDSLVVSKFTFSIIWVLEIIYLLYYVNKTNRSLSVFLESLRGSDFLKGQETDSSFKNLNLQSNQIIEIVKNARIERESQYHYFQYTLELIPVGVLSFNKENGQIEIFNGTAQEILMQERLNHVDDLGKVNSKIHHAIKYLPSGKHQLVQLEDGFQEKQIVLKAIEFNLFQRKIRVVSLLNIKQQLEQEELEAWQKLISVLRHEVMNSVGPVRSLARTLLRMFKKNGDVKTVNEISDKTISDTVTGLESIENRSRGMINFVQSYRELTKIPLPRKKSIQVNELFQGVRTLMESDLEEKNIGLVVHSEEENLALEADERQLTQILINLIKNASEAFSTEQTDKRIELSAGVTKEKVAYIKVSDNGPGIPGDIQKKIFIPFYTTKEGGSGIGLNFARQIMSLHGGYIRMHSDEGRGSTFVLEF